MKRLISLATVSFFATTAAFASAPVTVTVKNLNTTTAATFSIVGTNEQNSYNNSSPKPIGIPAGHSDVFTVLDQVNPNVNWAELQYSIGAKMCVFYTAYVNTSSTGGTITYTKSATPSGGATCTATITSTNLVTGAWTVTFTIQ